MKKVLVILQVIFLCFVFSACGSGQTESNQDLKQSENQAGYENSSNTVNNSTSDGNYQDSTGVTEDNSQNEAAYDEGNGQSDMGAFTFSDDLLGTYGSSYDTSQYIIIEKDGITLHNAGEDFMMNSGLFTETSVENTFTGFQEDTGVYLTLTFTISEAGTGYSLYVEYSNMATYISFQGELLSIADGIPLSSYVSLDTAGEFGTIPMVDAVKDAIVSQASDDYLIVYNPEYTVSTGESQYVYCECYSVASFDETGYQSYAKSFDAYACSSEDDAAKVAAYFEGYCVRQGNVVILTNSAEDPQHYFDSSKQAFLQNYSNAIVYGEHCFVYSDLNVICYMSKPFSIEQGKAWQEATLLIDKMYCNYSYTEDQTAFICLSGTGLCPSVTVHDDTTNMDASWTNFVKASGDMLIAYGNVYDYTDIGNSTYVTEFTTDGVNVTAHVMRFSGLDEVTYDNYTEYTPDKEVTVTVPLSQM